MAKNGKRIRVKLGEDRILSEQGELLDTVTRYGDVRVKVKTKYASMFLSEDDKYDALKGLGNFGAVWGYILSDYKRETCVFYFSASVKEDICKATKLSNGTIRSAITSFCDSGLLLKIRNAEYMVNPRHFFMGNWEQREQMIEVFADKKKAIEMLELNKSISNNTIK